MFNNVLKNNRIVFPLDVVIVNMPVSCFLKINHIQYVSSCDSSIFYDLLPMTPKMWFPQVVFFRNPGITQNILH